jgi:hypothetical protein
MMKRKRLRPLHLSRKQTDELMRLAKLYHREASRYADAKAYLPACVMLGAQLEAVLTLYCNIYAKEIPADEIPTSGKERSAKHLLDWKLAELLRVAKKRRWLPSGLTQGEEWNSKKAKVGDHAEVVHLYRNLAHPAAYLSELPRGRVTRQRMEWCFEVLAAVIEWLMRKVNANLRHAMTSEDMKRRVADARLFAESPISPNDTARAR